MKIGGVISACNDNPYYYEFVPVFVKAWQTLYPDIRIRIIFVTTTPERLPHVLVPFVDCLVPIMKPENVSSMFMSQFVRILYPSIWQISGAILTTDIDMLPMNRSYFTLPIRDLPDNAFVVFRPPSDNQIYICYTAASWETWRRITGAADWEGIIRRIHLVYEGIPVSERNQVGAKGWYADQLALYQFVMNNAGVDPDTGRSRIHILSDASTGFRRLDRGPVKFFMEDHLKPHIADGHFSDYHMHRPFHAHAELIQSILQTLAK